MAMNLRLSEADDAALEMYASAQGLSKHEAVLRAIRNETGRMNANNRVDQLVADALVEYAGLLDRLSK